MKRPAAPRLAGDRRYRLTGVGAFDAVLRNGRRVDGTLIQLVATPARQSPGRAGLVVGRKQLSRAVDRNHLKRLMRAMLRFRRAEIVALDLIVRVRRPLARHEIASAAAEAAGLLARLTREAAP